MTVLLGCFLALALGVPVWITIGLIHYRKWKKKRYDIPLSESCDTIYNLWAMATQQFHDITLLKTQIKELERNQVDLTGVASDSDLGNLRDHVGAINKDICDLQYAQKYTSGATIILEQEVKTLKEAAKPKCKTCKRSI